MGGIRIFTNNAAAQRKLLALQGAFDDKQELFGAIGNVLLNKVRLGFKMGRDPWGRKWLPIKFRAPRVSAKTGKLTKYGQKQVQANRSGRPGDPLRDTGRLRNSITSRVDPDGVTVGTNVQYATTHQFGAEIRPKNFRAVNLDVGPGRRAIRFLAFPGPNGQIIFAKRVVVPARPFMPISRFGAPVVLPVAWSRDVVKRIKSYALARVRTADAVASGRR